MASHQSVNDLVTLAPPTPQMLAQENIEVTKEQDMMMLFMSNINREYVAFLKQNGYKDISKSKLVDELFVKRFWTKDVASAGATHGFNGIFKERPGLVLIWPEWKELCPGPRSRRRWRRMWPRR